MPFPKCTQPWASRLSQVKRLDCWRPARLSPPPAKDPRAARPPAAITAQSAAGLFGGRGALRPHAS